MALTLNKSVLKRQHDQLKLYQKSLPSLDLRRKKLTAEQKKTEAVVAAIESEIRTAEESVVGLLALLGGTRANLSGLVRVRGVELGEENVAGVRLPTLGAVVMDVAPYRMLALPFWVDQLIDVLRQTAELQVKKQVWGMRVARLRHEVRRATQRVNLFDKVLIPRTKKNIQRIGIALADAERSAVVRSKIAKRLRQQPADA